MSCFFFFSSYSSTLFAQRIVSKQIPLPLDATTTRLAHFYTGSKAAAVAKQQFQCGAMEEIMLEPSSQSHWSGRLAPFDIMASVITYQAPISLLTLAAAEDRCERPLP